MTADSAASAAQDGVMIRVSNVTRRFGATVAAQNVSFTVRRGEIVGFLGPNGAGKSTVLKMISTWLPPTSGTIEVAGHDVQHAARQVRRCIGYLPEHNAMYESMRVDRFLLFNGRIRGMREPLLGQRIRWVISKCSLREALGKKISQCSKGFRQRIGLAAALLYDPPVILLDEPTHGLDPLQVVAFRSFIQELRPNRAIVFSSHILAEVIAVCERLLIISHGRLLADVAVKELEDEARRTGVEVERAVLRIVRTEQAVTV